MKRAGVIGYPLGHSLSSAIFQPAFESAGIDAQYEGWETNAEELEARVGELRADDVLGANVTVPYKESVMSLLDEVDDQARQIGAVNTIVSADGTLTGHNTDVAGFDRALRDDADFDPRGKRVVVLGAGGAARAISFALVEGGASIVMIAGRTPKRMAAIVNELRGLTKPGTTITWVQWGEGPFLKLLPEADLVVNCTPVGTIGSGTEDDALISSDLIPANGLVFDLVYNPQETALLIAAKERGASTISGMSMLVYQAAESFRLWTGQDAPIDQMLEAGRAAL